MQIKSYNHQSIAEWSNSKNYSELLACAQINHDQNKLYNLDILSLDLSDRSKNLNVIGNAFYNVPFRCLAWDTFGQKQNAYPNGIIFAGMQDGSYTLWNAHQMIVNFNKGNIKKSQESIQLQTAFLYGQQAEQDSYPIMCAEWNTLKNNFLAFGSTDLLILDIGKDISNPQIKKPGTRNPHQGSYITSVSWNKQVANILASASQNGLIALWDIKANKSIFQFKDSPSSSNGARNVVICWNKTISTQLAVTLDDQKRNELQIWDLRNQKGPVAVFDRGHTRGINTMQWCQTDPELILTGGRDNRIVCWNYTQQQGPISTQQLNQQIYNIKWSKKLKSIYSVSTDDKTQIYTLDDSNLFSYVPKWYKVPVGSTFFGNQSILKYSQNQGNKLTQIKLNTILNFQNHRLQNLLKQLQAALDQNLPQPQNDNEFWSLINAKNSNLGDQAIYDYLGYNKQKIIKEVEKYTGKKRENQQVKTQAQPKNKIKSKAYTPVIGQQAASFFASIGENNTKNTAGNSIQQQDQNQNVKYDMVPRNFNWNTGKQRLIKHNILIGNYQGAIDAAIKCGRTAQALIIAYSVDQNTFNSTLKTFFTETTDNFITDILKNITYRDNEQLVRKYNVENWKQCIALIYSISSSQKRKNLLNLLASRIRQQNLKHSRRISKQIVPQNNAAIQCYVLSQNFNQIANLYYQNLQLFQNGTLQRKQIVVQYAKRLILIYDSLATQVELCKNFRKIIRQAAFIATQENHKIVSYLIFTNFLYESSLKQIDMIINSTKSLQEYKNSIVFPLVNIPVMQFKQQTAQKNKKGHSQVQNQSNQNNQNYPKNTNKPPIIMQPNHNVQQNMNIPTKDKQNVPPKPPIFNKKQEVKEVVKNVPTPPPSYPNKPHKNQGYQEDQQINNQPQKVNKSIKKVPPPPVFKSGNKNQEQLHHNQNQGHVSPPPPSVYHQKQPQNQSSNSYENNMNNQKRNNSMTSPPPPIKNKKTVPPPPGNKSHQNQDEQENHSSYYNQSQKKQQTTFAPQPPQNGNRIPPPPPGRPKNENMSQSFQQHNNLTYQQEQRPSHNMSQKFSQSSIQHQQTKGSRTPPPPPSSNKKVPPPPMKKQADSEQIQEQQNVKSFNKIQPPYSNPHTSSKKNIPPPPSNLKKDSNSQNTHYGHSTSNNNYYEQCGNSQIRLNNNYQFNNPNQNQHTNQQQFNYPPQSNSGIKPPPPANKQNINSRVPPLPLNKQSSSGYENQNEQSYYQQQNSSYYQQEQHNNSSKNQQHQTPVVKRPPPPVSNKKGPPPPPRR